MKKILRNPDITKEKILSASEKCFSEKGFYGARVDEIASISGVNKRMIYAYFGNKEDLYKAVIKNVYDKMGEFEISYIDEDAGCIEAIKKIIYSNFMFLYNNPTFVKIMMWENLNEAVFAKSMSLGKIKKPVYDKIRKILLRGIEENVFREDIDIESVIFDTIAFCFSYFSNRFTLSEIFNTNFYEEELLNKRIEHICDCILSYLLK